MVAVAVVGFPVGYAHSVGVSLEILDYCSEETDTLKCPECLGSLNFSTQICFLLSQASVLVFSKLAIP
jgi:hypothetical protein